MKNAAPKKNQLNFGRFRKIAAAGVSLRFAVPVGMSGDNVQIGLGADDAAALKAAIGA